MPGIAGPAGWRVYLGTRRDEQQEIGLIYTRDDLGQQDQICRLSAGKTTLGELARRTGLPELDVYASYLTFDRARPLALDEITGAPPSPAADRTNWNPRRPPTPSGIG